MRIDTSFDKIRSLCIVAEAELLRDVHELKRVEEHLRGDYPSIYLYWVFVQDTEQVHSTSLFRVVYVHKKTLDMLGRWKDEAVTDLLGKQMDMVICLGPVERKLTHKFLKAINSKLLVGTYPSDRVPFNVVVSSSGESALGQFKALKNYLNDLNYETSD